MKIFPSSSIKKLDAYTIEHEPIASIDLMERAAQALTKAITNRWNPETPVTIFAGPGNNGGDALAIARMMAEKGYKIEVYLFNTKGELSPDCQTNKELVEMMEEVTFHEISTQFVPPTLTPEHLVIDGLFGWTQQTIERRIRCRCEIYQCLSRHGSLHRHPFRTDGRRKYIQCKKQYYPCGRHFQPATS